MIHAAGFRKNAGQYTIVSVQPSFIEVAQELKDGDETPTSNESLVKRLSVHITTGVLRVEMDNNADGQVVAIGDTFDVGGESLEYPGDPAGSPENVINCRCALLPIISEARSYRISDSLLKELSAKLPSNSGGNGKERVSR